MKKSVGLSLSPSPPLSLLSLSPSLSFVPLPPLPSLSLSLSLPSPLSTLVNLLHNHITIAFIPDPILSFSFTHKIRKYF